MRDLATLDAEPTARSFRSQGLTLSYLDWGGDPGAPVLLLLHGSRDHARSWDWTARALRRDGWRIVAPDLRGHGDSDWSPDSAYLASYHLLDLADLIAHLGAPQVTIVAHSFSGAISARYAGMYPERVRKLVLVDGMGPGNQVFDRWNAQGSVARSREWVERRTAMTAKSPPTFATIEDAVARMAASNPHLTADQADHLARHGARLTPAGWVWKSDPLMNVFPPEDFYAETPDVWAALACPVLIFWAAKSYTLDPMADGRAALIRDRRTIVYDDVGHWLHHERFDDVIAEIRAFLA
jgi:pimeloyl-ACP methyl ester carboxylesterase